MKSFRHPLLSFPPPISFILAVAAVLRISFLGHKQLWVDEIIQVLHSRPTDWEGILAGIRRDCGAAPLDYLLEHVFLRFVPGPLPWVARLHAALAGILCVWVLYLLGRRLLGENRGRLAALLLAIYPLHQAYSQEGRFYSLFTLLALVTVLLFHIQTEEHRPLRWILFTGVALLSFLTYPYTAFLLLALLVSWWLTRREVPIPARGFLPGFLASSALAAAGYLPWLLSSLEATRGTAPQAVDLQLFLRLIKELAGGSYPLALLAIPLVLLGARDLYRNRERRALSLLACWALTPLPLILGLLLWRDYFLAVRQLLFLTPALCLLMAAGLSSLKSRIAFRLAGGAILVLSLAVVALHVPDNREDLRGAGLWLAGRVRTGDTVLAGNAQGLLSLYFPDIYRYGSPPSPAQRPGESRPGRLYIVSTPFQGGSDPARSPGNWGNLRETIRFRKVTIGVYDCPGR